MRHTTRKDSPTVPAHDRHDAAPDQKDKKTYRKPELAKYEQLHGIGIGS
jgi:ribosomal protein S30